MARRPRARVDTSRLRAMGETSAVVARPVDTYVRPAAPQKNQQYAQILSALSTVNPALDNFITDKVTKDREKQANKGEKSFYEATPEERKAVSAQIKSGEINELQSPFWVEGFARSLLRNHATTFGSALTLEWNRQKDSGGFDFNAFVAEERGKYIEANNLSSFRSDLFNDEFAAVTRTFENQVLQRNYEHRISQAKKARMQSLGDSMFTVIQGMQEALDTEKFDGQKGDTFSAQINAEIQAAIDQGLDPSGVISMAEGFLQGTILDLAQNEENQDIAKGMLRNLKLKSGTYGIVYKDKYEAIERNADRIMLRAEADAEQADNDELETQQLGEYKQVYDGLVEAINSTDPTALNTYWKSDEVKALRRSIGYLDGITEGENLLPTLNNLFQTKGIVPTTVSDAEFVDVMNGQILGQNLNDAQVRKIAEDSGFSYPQIREAVNANNGQAAQFLKNIKLPDIEKALAAEVNTKGLFEFGDSARTSFAAVDAVAELKEFIKAQMVSMGDTPEDALAARAAVSAKAKELAEVYGDRARLENDNFNQTNNPRMKPASQETVELWKSGQYTPWKNENGSMVAGINGNSAEAFAAANDAGRPFDSTEIGKLIGPLILAGVSPDVILSQIATAYEAANATEKEDAQVVLAPVLQKAQTRADAAVDQSATIVGNIRPYVEPVIETALNTVSDLISGETDTAVAADAALEAAQQFLSPEAKERIASGTTGKNPEATQESGTSDTIGAINETIADLGEDFLKAVASSFEATGKAGVEVAAKLLAEEPDPDKALAAAQQYLSPEAKIRIQNASTLYGSQKAADAALAIAQQYLSKEAKDRIAEKPLDYTATPSEIEAMNDVLGKTDLDNMNEVAARVQAVYPDINEQQLRDIIKRVSDYRAADGSTARPVGVDMSVPSMVAPASSMQSPSMSSPTSDGAVNTGVAPKSESSMMPASFKTQLPEAGSAGQAVTLDEGDAKILRGILRDQRIAEFKAKRAENAAAVKMERTARQDAMRMQRKNVSKKEAAKAEEERQNKLRIEREERQQEYLQKQAVRRSKTISKIIAERAKKFPEKYGATMSDDLASYLNKTKPLWSNYWDTVLADGEEIPAVFYEVLKENMRKRISN